MEPFAETSGNRATLPSDIRCVDDVRTAFAAFLGAHGLGPEPTESWLLTLSEMAVNAIEHGNGNDPSKRVTIAWNRAGETVTLEVADEGNGPPASLTEAPKLPDDPLSTDGRGLYLIRSFVDRWEHWRGSGGYCARVSKTHPELSDLADNQAIMEQTLNELSTSYESLAAFYRLGDGLVRSENVTHFIEQACADLARVARHDLLALCFHYDFQEPLAAELNDLPTCSACLPSPIQQRVMESRQEWIWETPEEVDGVEALQPYACGICVPVQAAGTVFGVLWVARKHNDPYFNAGELNTIRTFADLTGIAVANAHNTLNRRREERALRELEIASNIQENLLPLPSLTAGEGWSAFARRKGAREVAGDHVEIAYGPNDELFLVCVDVMGKGVSAAFLAAIFRTAFHISLALPTGVAELTARLNNVLYTQMGGLTMFATCAIAKVSADLGTLEIVNAGHCPVVVADSATTVTQVEPSGPPLGLFPDLTYTTETLPVTTKTRLLMVTDGLYEWECNGEIWGWETLIDYIRQNIDLESEVFWHKLQHTITTTGCADAATSDDMTLLYWRRDR